jgi:dihydroxyacetone kinase
MLLQALPRLASASDELRDLDAAIGDGDLGITVSAGCAAAARALAEIGEDDPPGVILRAIAPAVARANPSTFAALVATGLLAASRALGDRVEVGPDDIIAAGRQAAQAIAARGKSAVGDKTLLDALAPSLEAAAAEPGRAFDAALEAARFGVESTRDLVSTKGRAAWVGERTRGHADPGATAYVRLLEALDSSTSTNATGGARG